jgi:hypothetical protein
MKLKQWIWDNPVVVLAVLLPAILVPHLLDLGYWATDVETLLIGGAALLIGLLCAPIESALPRIANFLIALAVYWLVDVFFDKQGYFAACALGLSALLLRSRYGADARRAILAFCLVWTTANLSQSSKLLVYPKLDGLDASAKNSSLPPLIHIILDAQMSPLAIPDTVPRDSASTFMLDDYSAHGFKVYSRAVSRFPWTRWSLGQLVSFRPGKEFEKLSYEKLMEMEKHSSAGQNLLFELDDSGTAFFDNEYFRKLHELGYSLVTLQSSGMIFCADPLPSNDVCLTYPVGNFGHSQALIPGAISDRLSSAFYELLNDYLRNRQRMHFVLLGNFVESIFGGIKVPIAGLSQPATAVAAYSQLRPLLAAPQRGQAYFIHLLLPHEPFVLTSDCALNKSEDWATVATHGQNVNSYEVAWNTSNPYTAYWTQVECAHSLVMSIFTDALASPQGKDAIFIVHGDHGSRVSYFLPESRHRVEPTSDMLMTFLAVKAPFIGSGQVTQPVVLQDLFRDLFEKLASCLKQQAEMPTIECRKWQPHLD